MCLIKYSDKATRILVFVMPKISGYVKTFKVKDGDKDENYKFLQLGIDDEKLLERYEGV